MQMALLLVSVALLARGILGRFSVSIARPEGHPSSIPLPFELCSQVARALALGLAVVAAVRHGISWANVVLLAYVFVLGIVKLSNDVNWRQIVLHQVNFTLAGAWLVFVTGELLPAADAGVDFSLPPVVLGSMATLTVAVLLALVTPREWVPPSLDLDLSDKVAAREPSPEETCSWLDYYVTYEWLTPLMWRGIREQVTIGDLPPLPWYDEPLLLLRRIKEARRKSQSTLWTLVRFLPKELALMGFFAAFSFTAELVAPFALYQLLSYIEHPETSAVRPHVWLLLLFFGPMARSVTFQQYIFTSTRLVVRVKSALTQELYYKAVSSMELDDESFHEISFKEGTSPGGKAQVTSAGRLANLMSADIDAITRGRDLILVTFGLPPGTLLALVGMYNMLGWPALAGIAFMVLMSPVGLTLAQRMVGLQREEKKVQDSRISAITEYLASIRAVKYFAWENAVIRKINEIRLREQKVIWNINIQYTVSVYPQPQQTLTDTRIALGDQLSRRRGPQPVIGFDVCFARLGEKATLDSQHRLHRDDPQSNAP